jgi:DNA-binding NtrC family response regulator
VTGALPVGPVATPAAPFDLEVVKRRHVADVLTKMKGTKVQAARALGISRRALYRLIDKYRLAPKAERAPDAPELAGASVVSAPAGG